MKALIDGDILLYELGSCTDDEGHPLKWPLVKARVDGKIHQIKQDAECDEYIVYLTGDNNFRKTEATIKPYKGNRKGVEKPFHHQHIKDYLLKTKNHTVSVCENYEADDGMAIEQTKGIAQKYLARSVDPEIDLYSGTCICSRDKDLRMVAGNHFSWKSGKQPEATFSVTDKEGYHWFFMQLLMGDPVDNIPGLYMIGMIKAEKLLGEASEPLDWYSVAQHQYEVRFGSYWKLFMHENARLLWMMRTEEDDIRDWLNDLETARLEQNKKEY